MYVQQAEMTTTTLNRFTSSFDDKQVAYYYEEVIVGTKGIAKGVYTETFTQAIMQGKVPHKIIIGFVETEAFKGTKHRNPFDFRRHFNNNCKYRYS